MFNNLSYKASSFSPGRHSREGGNPGFSVGTFRIFFLSKMSFCINLLLGSRLRGNDDRGGASHTLAYLRPVPFLFLLLSTPSFAETALEKRATALYQEVRCPVCLGQSIADSETDESQALKTFILEKLKRGEPEDAIREKLRELYGDAILLRPPFETHTLFLWLAPFGLCLLIGLGIGWKILQSRTRGNP